MPLPVNCRERKRMAVTELRNLPRAKSPHESKPRNLAP
jgi:hypothetical protein